VEHLVFDWYWIIVPLALLPIAALSGWHASNHKNSHKRTIAPEYIKGLNYLLDQQTDKAVEIFIKFFQVDTTTLETHILLGNLFRRKGELEKAIRIHSNLIQRAQLSDNAKCEALFELGQDYLYAGLLSNAEEIFKRLIAVGTAQTIKKGYQNLITIYEMEKSWQQAIDCAQRLQKLELDYAKRITHYYCELADKELAEKNYAAVNTLLNKAQAYNNASARVRILKGDLAAHQGHSEQALRYYSAAFAEYPGYADVLLPKIKNSFSSGAPDYADYIKQLEPEEMTVLYIISYIKALFEARRVDEAEQFLFHLIESKRAPLQILKIFIEEKLKGTDLLEDKVVRQIIDEINASLNSDYFYMCEKCGFKAYQLYWQCPSCHAWDSSNSVDIINASQSHPKFSIAPK